MFLLLYYFIVCNYFIVLESLINKDYSYDNMMDGIKGYLGKRVYIITRGQRNYSGVVIEVDDRDNKLVFLTIIDKFNKKVTFLASELAEIKEEAK